MRRTYHHGREHKNISARHVTGIYQAIKERHTKYAKLQPLEFNALDAALLKSKLNVHMKKGGMMYDEPKQLRYYRLSTIIPKLTNYVFTTFIASLSVGKEKSCRKNGAGSAFSSK